MGDRADLVVIGAARSTVFIVSARTEAGHAWVEDNVSQDGYQPRWPDLIVEHRYLTDLIGGAQAAGLGVGFLSEPPYNARA